MNQVLIVMAILGCSDAGTECQTVQRVNAGFTSVEACNAATPRVLENLTTLSYPTIMAQCQKVARPALALNETRPAS